MAYEFDYRVQAGANLTADLALFCHDSDELRVSVAQSALADPSGAVIRPLRVENAVTGETYGAELGMQWQVSRASQLHAAYTLLMMNLHRHSGLPASAEAAEKQSPQQQLYLRSAWALPRSVELDLIGRSRTSCAASILAALAT